MSTNATKFQPRVTHLSLPPTDRQALIDALEDFDARWRPTPEWANWQSNGSQRYALVFEGKRYPPKKIVSLATGVPVSEFSGGREANDFLARNGFEVVPLGRLALPRFEVGRIYDRWTDIHRPFGGSRQSAISVANTAPAIFLFAGESGMRNVDPDNADADGVFSFKGEVPRSDMAFDRGNAAIRDHARDGRALHLFRTLEGQGGQEYLGEVVYANHALRTGPGVDGDSRPLVVFHLVPVNVATLQYELDELDALGSQGEAPDLKLARARALEASEGVEGSGGKSALRTLYRRSAAVQRYVLLRANGQCESCLQPAPFTRKNGTPYLEPHHTTRVSDGGPDHPRFVAAVCPSCHREVHHGIDGDEKNAALSHYLNGIEGNSSPTRSPTCGKNSEST